MILLAAFLDNVWKHLHGSINGWTLFGLLGNGLFMSRFVVQWYVSERLKQSVIPKNFWSLSLVGGIIQLIYAVHIGYIPVILGYLLTPVIAVRNLMLIHRNGPPPDAPPPGDTPPSTGLLDDGSAPILVDPTGDPDQAEMAGSSR